MRFGRRRVLLFSRISQRGGGGGWGKGGGKVAKLLLNNFRLATRE